MNDLIKLLLAHLAEFLRTFLNLVASPRRALLSLRLFDGRNFNKGLIFFGLSTAIAILIKVPFTPSTVDLWIYTALDAIWKFILVAIATAGARLAWFGCQGQFADYFVANCYYFGIVSIVIPLLFILGLSPGVQGRTMEVLLFVVGLVSVVATLVWSGGAWLSFANFNRASVLSAFLRLPIFLVALFGATTLAWFVRAGTAQRAIALAGGDDYGKVDDLMFLLGMSFGLYP